MKQVIFSFAIFTIRRLMPLAIYVLRSSPTLQTLTLEGLKGNDFFARAIGQLGANRASYEEQITPNTSSTWMDFYKSTVPLATIVVPVYNAFSAVRRCLESLEQTLNFEHVEVLVIDDASTDERIKELILSYGEKRGFRTHFNNKNLGYTATVNLAFELCGGRDVVLLNSDTVVTGRWFQALRYAAYSFPRIASATAISNKAGAFSMVEYELAGQTFSELNALGKKITQIAEGRILEVPTGNGFCTYIRRDALDKIGVYDLGKYSRGYGEENDFAMRARRLGWKSVVCDKAFVFHEESQSFGAEKQELIRLGLRQLNQDFPEYQILTSRFWDPEFTHVRQRLKVELKKTPSRDSLKRILFVMPITGGGLPETNLDLISGLKGEFESFILKCQGTEVTLYSFGDSEEANVALRLTLTQPVDPLSHQSDEYDRLFADILYQFSIDVIHVEHLAWQSMGIADVAKSLDLPLFFTVHDYYSICASHNLIDDTGKFCGGTCTQTKGQCAVDLWPSSAIPVLKDGFIKLWQTLNLEFLETCRAIFAPSEAAGKILADKFPKVESKIKLIPHQRTLKTSGYAPIHIAGEKIRVLVLGNIGASKGAKVLEKICKSRDVQDFEFHFLGESWPNLRNYGIHHGKYDRDDVNKKILDIRPHVGILFSIWAETFSHTLTELVSAGIPVAALNLGAIGERTERMKAGLLLDPNSDPNQLIKEIKSFVLDQVAYSDVIRNIREVNSKELNSQSEFEMAKSYSQFYDQR